MGTDITVCEEVTGNGYAATMHKFMHTDNGALTLSGMSFGATKKEAIQSMHDIVREMLSE